MITKRDERYFRCAIHAVVNAILIGIKTDGLEKCLEDLRKNCTYEGSETYETYQGMVIALGEVDKLFNEREDV